MTNPSCPQCDGELEISTYRLHPDVAPWTCHVCHYAFFNSELTGHARTLWRKDYLDHGTDNMVIDIGRKKELKTARLNGSCIRVDQIPLLKDEHIQSLLGEELSVHFRTVVQKEVSGRANADS